MRIQHVAVTTAAVLSAIEAWTPSYRSTWKMSATSDAVIQSTPKLSRAGHDHQAWKRGFTTCPNEIPPTILDCPDLPDDFPTGTYYRNGHGRFESDDSVPAFHMFDGDGLVSAITFYHDKKLLFRNRFVRTDGYLLDKETGTMSKPGIFGTRVSGGFWKNLFRTDFKNVANTHMLYNGGKLYALWEGGWPYVLDPLTLENDFKKERKGHDLNGLLKKGESFAAHYRVDSRTGHVVGFGNNLDPVKGETKMKLYEFDTSMKPIRPDEEISFVFKGTGVTHDYGLTENWHVFVMPPAGIDQSKAFQALFGTAAFVEVVKFDTDATESTVYLVPRMKNLEKGTASAMRAGEDNRIKVIKVPYHFNFHFGNAFEDENGEVVIDSVLTDKPQLGDMSFPKDIPLSEQVDLEDFFPTKYVRFSVSPEFETLTPGTSFQTITTRDPEFPTIPLELSSRKHQYVYAVGTHQPYQTKPDGRGKGAAGAILKLDTENPENNESYSFLPHEFVGEPVFVPKMGADVTKTEDKGYLMLYVLNGRDLTTDMVVFDVDGKGKLEEGPVTRVRLPTFIPHGLHGTFVKGLTFDM